CLSEGNQGSRPQVLRPATRRGPVAQTGSSPPALCRSYYSIPLQRHWVMSRQGRVFAFQGTSCARETMDRRVPGVLDRWARLSLLVSRSTDGLGLDRAGAVRGAELTRFHRVGATTRCVACATDSRRSHAPPAAWRRSDADSDDLVRIPAHRRRRGGGGRWNVP